MMPNIARVATEQVQRVGLHLREERMLAELKRPVASSAAMEKTAP